MVDRSRHRMWHSQSLLRKQTAVLLELFPPPTTTFYAWNCLTGFSSEFIAAMRNAFYQFMTFQWRRIMAPKWNGSVSKPCTPVVHIKIAGKWMFIPLKMVLIGIDPYPNFSAFFNSFLMVFPLVQAVVSGTGTAAWTCQAKAKGKAKAASKATRTSDFRNVWGTQFGLTI